MMGSVRRLAARALAPIADRTILFSFDRTGYLLHRERFREDDLDVDLDGQRILVTGANSGLGRAAALELARLGGEVWLLCRNPERGRAAERELRREAGSEAVRFAQIDLSSRRSVLDFVDRFGERQVDVLIHNAGVLPAERSLTDDGLELTWATNVVGPFLLTWKLLPHLARAGGARVIHVSSGGMYTRRLDLRDLDWHERSFDGVDAYAQTKRAQVVLNELWQERLEGTGIASYAMHPGWADTPGVQTSLPRFRRIMRPLLRTSAEGADTIVWLAANQNFGDPGGSFWFDRRRVPAHLTKRTRTRPGDREALWRLCRDQAGLDGEPWPLDG